MALQVMNPASIHEDVGSLSGLRISIAVGYRYSSDPMLHVAVVWAGSCSSDSAPSLGTSMCHGYGPKKAKYIHNTIK